ncbi:MAG TPA: DUF4394 domain-containing protein, partial [Burkholderiaceae bacterium]
MPHSALQAALRGATLSAAAFAAFAVSAPAQAQQIVGLTTTNALLTFGAATPQNGSALMTITGLEGTNQRILAIDTRPTNGLIYGVSTDSKLYTLDAATGVATKVANLSIALNGTAFGFDFNPVADTGGAASLRITSDTGQNLAVNATTGATTVQTGLTFNAGSIGAAGAAYRDNDANPATSAVGLYYIDSDTDGLYFTGAPGGGVLSFVGSLGFDTTGVLGFDIAGAGNMAYAGLTLNGTDTGKSGLYSINLGTGAATLIGDFGIFGNTAISPPLLGLTVAAVPEPGTYAMLIAGLLGIGLVSRRRAA